MKQNNINIFKSLRANAFPMNRFDLVSWLEAMLSVTDLSATVKGCIDELGFVAHTVTLSDGNGADRSFIVPSLSNTFTFDEYNIGSTYSIKSPRTRVGRKNMYVREHSRGLILVSYNSTIAFYHTAHNVVYFKRNAFNHRTITTRHVSTFLTRFVNADALKMFAKQTESQI